MDKDRLDRFEAALGIALPVNYRRFVETLPEDGGTLIWEGPIYIELINDAERLTVRNLELRQCEAVFAGERWPYRYLAIGDDGCGNIYRLDAGDISSPALLMYDHDSEDDFIEAAPSYSALFASLKTSDATKGRYAPSSESDPYLVVTRASAAWKSVLHPIGLDEWSEYLRTDPTMRCLGYRQMTNPFTKKVMQIDRPGYAFWEQPDGAQVAVEFSFGRLRMEGDSTTRVEKMKQIAQALSARLFGAEGAEIEVV